MQSHRIQLVCDDLVFQCVSFCYSRHATMAALTIVKVKDARYSRHSRSKFQRSFFYHANPSLIAMRVVITKHSPVSPGRHQSRVHIYAFILGRLVFSSTTTLEDIRKCAWCRKFTRHLSSLLHISRFLTLGVSRSILHLLVGLCVTLLPCSLLGLLLGLLLLGLRCSTSVICCFSLGSSLFLDLPASLLFFLALLVEARNDECGRCAKFLELGDILCFLGVFAIFIQPVLRASC